MRVQLHHLAHVRSGDKGNTALISVIAYSDPLFEILCEQLTPEAFKAHYRGAITGEVTRHRLDNLGALQFVCEGALGGGVSRSLAMDNFGKALCSAVLGFEVEVPDRMRNLLVNLAEPAAG